MTRRQLMTLKEITDAVDAGKTVCWRDESCVVKVDVERCWIEDLRSGRVVTVLRCEGESWPLKDTWKSKDFYILDEPASEAGVNYGTAKAYGDRCADYAGRATDLLDYFLGIPDPVAAVEELKARLEEMHKLSLALVAAVDAAQAGGSRVPVGVCHATNDLDEALQHCPAALHRPHPEGVVMQSDKNTKTYEAIYKCRLCGAEYGKASTEDRRIVDIAMLDIFSRGRAFVGNVA